MKVAMVGGDASPSFCFREVEVELQEIGIGVISFLGSGRPFAVDEASIRAADILLLGMSMTLYREEVAAGMLARGRKIPYGFFADTFGSHLRPQFAELREAAGFVFVLNEKEAASAREAFPNARIVVSGHPGDDDSFWPAVSRPEVRGKLGVAEDEKMVLVVGHKPLFITMPLLTAVIEAVHSPELSGYRFKVFFSPHPGDQLFFPGWETLRNLLSSSGLSENQKKELAELLKFRDAIYSDPMGFSSVPVRLLHPEELATSSALPGADLVIGTASTVERQAACQRKPAISFLPEIALARNITAFAKREWELAELGVSWPIYHMDVPALAKAMRTLLTPEGFSSQREIQEQVFPRPAQKGAAVKIMVTALQELCRQ